MTNAQILAAVVVKWAEPVIPAMLGTAVSGVSSALLPFERFLKNFGLVRTNWSVEAEVAQLMALGGGDVVRPFVTMLCSKIPDAVIPQVAHSYVDKAIQAGSLSVIDGKFTFEQEDLKELKRYLECNLPYQAQEDYVVKIPPKAQNGTQDSYDTQKPKPDGR